MFGKQLNGKYQLIRILCALGFLMMIICNTSRAQMPKDADFDAKVDDALNFAQKQLKRTIAELNNDSTKFPHAVRADKDSSWITTSSSAWGCGYFPGMMWYMYEITGDEFWKKNANRWTLGVEKEKYNKGAQDLGFMITSSFGNAYRLTKNKHYGEVLLETGEHFANRYNSVVGCTRSWGPNEDNKQFQVIIDNMVGTELLFTGAKIGGKKDWFDMAIKHAEKTMKNHLRSDGSTYHVVNYDPVTGVVIGKRSAQGYALESRWARGQAWAIHGFTTTARETSEGRFLQTAQKVADYFINNLPENYIPYWDFHAPNIPDEKRDTSAASIAASGLFELSTLVEDDKAKQKYFDSACKILNSLCSPPYLSEGTDTPAILLEMIETRYDARDPSVKLSCIWGDYFFVEAIVRYQKIRQNIE